MTSYLKKWIRNRAKKLLQKDSNLDLNSFEAYFRNVKIDSSNFKKRILLPDEANEILYNSLKGADPLMVSRFGNGELLFLMNFLNKNLLGEKEWHPYVKYRAFRMNAIWPHTSEAIDQFVNTYLEAIPSIDILGVWFNRGEDFFSNYIIPNVNLVPLYSLESYFFDDPWTKALKGKKVLVIHPYSVSIESQFRKKDKLFRCDMVLPDFELLTYKPVNVYTDDISQFPSWLDALNKMKNEIEKISFDVAMIAAGPFGLPLSYHVKKIGRQALHIGGALQLYFGIKGKRWESREQSVHFNEHWVYPSDLETPNDEIKLKVDNGDYWK